MLQVAVFLSVLSLVLLAKVLEQLRAMLPSHLILNFLTHPQMGPGAGLGSCVSEGLPGPSSLVYILSSAAPEGAGKEDLWTPRECESKWRWGSW